MIIRTNAIQFRLSLWLIVILGLGVGLRLIDLSGKVLWSDEWHTLDVVRLGPWQLTEFLAFHWPHLPLSYWIFYAASLLGENDTILRLPSVIFGSLTIYATYRLGALLLDEPRALLGALLLAVNPLHLMYSRLAVMYALFTFLAVWSFYGFFATLREKGRMPWLQYGIATLLLCYTHYFAFWVILAQMVYLGVTWRGQAASVRWRTLGSLTIVGLLFLPWIVVNYPALVNFSGKGYWLRDFPWFLRLGFTFFQFSLGESVAPWNTAIIVPMAVLSGIAILVAGWSAWKHSVSGERVVVGILLGLSLILSLLGKSTPKHATFLLPLYSLTLATGIMVFWRNGLRWVMWVMAAGILLLSGASLTNYFTNRQIADRSMVIPAREVAGIVQKGERPGDIVVLSGWSRERFQRYYRGELPLVETQVSGVATYGKEPAPGGAAIQDTYRERSQEAILKELGAPGRVWLLRIAADRPMQKRWFQYFHENWIEQETWPYASGYQALRGLREGNPLKYQTYYVELTLFQVPG